jgi:hypothetical protein
VSDGVSAQTLGDYSHVIGHRFPGGRTRVPVWMNLLWRDAVLADAPDDAAAGDVHPVLVYYAAVQGSGVSFQDIFDLLEGSAESGIMLAEQRFAFNRPMRVETDYEVEGGIVDVVRKEGRRAGVFDIATFELRVLEPDVDEPVAVSTTAFVFPRGSGTA